MGAEAAAVLRQIDEIEKTQDLDTLIRREIAARRQKTVKSASGQTCPSCGSENPSSNKFCAECGVKLHK